LRATNEIYAGQDGVQSAGADTVDQGVPANPGSPELMQVQMPVL
jgi:hypothetical protein